MAATVVKNYVDTTIPMLVCRMELSTLVAGATEVLSPTGAPASVLITPFGVEFEVTTPPTDGSDVRMSHTANGSGTVSVKFDTNAGGSLDGCKGTLRVRYKEQAQGGIS